jgi:hypothetical protein
MERKFLKNFNHLHNGILCTDSGPPTAWPLTSGSRNTHSLPHTSNLDENKGREKEGKIKERK